MRYGPEVLISTKELMVTQPNPISARNVAWQVKRPDGSWRNLFALCGGSIYEFRIARRVLR
jgi:hypothetical protein